MISVTILTKNSSKTLEKTLESLKGFSEVLIYDNGSVDSTLEIAKKFPNTKIVQGEFFGFGPSHNIASSLATHDWIFSLDSDEVVSENLAGEILKMPLDPNCVYGVSRHNFFWGKWMKCCSGWYPDIVLRIYNRKKTRFSDDMVHEKVLLGDLQRTILKNPVYHTPYGEISDFLKKMETYTTLFAEQNAGKRTCNFFTLFLHSWATFFKSYFLKRGFLGGKEGFIISAYNAHTAYYKYLKLMEKNAKIRSKPQGPK